MEKMLFLLGSVVLILGIGLYVECQTYTFPIKTVITNNNEKATFLRTKQVVKNGGSILEEELILGCPSKKQATEENYYSGFKEKVLVFLLE